MGITYRKNQVTGRRLAKQTPYPVTIGNGITNWGRFNAEQTVTIDSIFSRQTIDSNTPAVFDSAIGPDGLVHVIYIIGTALWYARNSGVGGTWEIQNTGQIASNASIIVGNEPTPYVSIIAILNSINQIFLYFKTHNAAIATAFSSEVIYNPGPGGSPQFDYPRIATTSTGLLRVSFTRTGSSAASQAVYYSAKSVVLPAGTNWSSPPVNILPSGSGNGKDSTIVVSSTNTPYVIVANATGYEIHNAISSPLVAIPITYSTTWAGKIVPGGRKAAVIDSSDNIHILIDDQTNNNLLTSTVVNIAGTPTESSSTVRSYSGAQILPTLFLNSATQKFHIAAAEDSGSMSYSNNESGSFITQLIDASSYNGAITWLKPSVTFANSKVNLLHYDNVSNVTTAPKLLFSTMTPTPSIKYNIGSALIKAIDSLPSSGGEIEILDGSYYLDSTVTVSTNNVKISGNGTATKINIDTTLNTLKVNASGVIVKNLQLSSINPITYTNAAQNDMEPLLELLPTTSTNCTVDQVTFSRLNSESVEKDIEWTIADGHIVNNNISTTAVSGLGGI